MDLNPEKDRDEQSGNEDLGTNLPRIGPRDRISKKLEQEPNGKEDNDATVGSAESATAGTPRTLSA